MWQRFTFYDVRVIAHYLGVLIMLVSAALAIPFVTALIFQEWEPASHYLFSSGAALCIGSLLRMLRVSPGRLTRQQALAVTGLAWIVLALIGAIPLYLSGHFNTYYDALFDSVAGFTATGASIISDLDHLSYADNMWRFVMHFFGGLGLVVVALSMGILGKMADSSLYSSEGRSEHVVPNVVETARFIFKFSISVVLVVTALLTVIFAINGMQWDRSFLHSLWLSITAFMTAGFAPMSSSLMYYHSFVAEVVLIVAMLMGCVNFGLFAEVLKGNTHAFTQDIEVRTGVIWLFVMLAIFVAAMCATDVFSSLEALMRRGVFTFVSAATTTGLLTVTSDQLVSVFPGGGFFVLALVMAVGGAAGSTAGGIKLSRIGIIARSMIETIKGTVSPDSARIVTRYYHLGWRRLDPALTKEAMTIFVLFVITFMLGALVGIAHGNDAVEAIFNSISAASNGGLSSDAMSAGMPFPLQTVFMLEMWAGRLEFVTLLALIMKIAASLNPTRKVKKKVKL